MKPTVMLIDFSNLWWSAWHTSGGDAVSMARQRTRESIERAAGSIPGCLVAVCLDAGRSFRKEMLAEYKANRPEKDQAVLAEMDRCKEALRAGGYLLWAADGFEADDVIATAAHAAVAAGHPFCIASADKDLLQLLALPESSALRTHSWQMVTAKDVVTKYGVEPESLGDLLALTGDKSDNIPGCPGVGDVRARDLLLAHGDIGGIYARIDTLQTGTGTGGAPYVETMTPAAKAIATPAVVRELWKNRAAVMLARKLVELRTDAPIKFEEIHSPPKPQETDMSDDDVPISSGPGPQPGAPVTPIRPAAPEVDAEPITALVASGVTYERALEPMSTTSAVQLADKLFNSRLFTHYGTKEAVLATMLAGRELGLGAIASLRAFHNIEGKLAMHWQLIVWLAESSPDVEYIMPVGQATAESSTWIAKNKRHPKPIEFTYTIEDARLAGLLEVKPGKQGGPWLKRPKDQLSKTAASKLAKLVAPGRTLGFYCAAELGADDDEGQVAA
jgi:5'-3' exonuclease